MKPIRTIAFLLLVGLWIAPSITPAQDNNSCSTIVQDALAVTNSACDGTGRNQACYGNIRLEAVTRPEFGNIRFTQQGDLADIELRTAALGVPGVAPVEDQDMVRGAVGLTAPRTESLPPRGPTVTHVIVPP